MSTMERSVYGANGEVTVTVTDGVKVVVGVNGESSNPKRHATSLTPDEARKLAKLLNAAADFA